MFADQQLNSNQSHLSLVGSASASKGVEWFAHGFELGPRKAKEFLFTSDTWSAQEAWRLGMVNHVVKPGELHGFTQNMARKIAQKPAFALKLAKSSVNQALDIAGQQQAIDAAFSIHHIAHRYGAGAGGRRRDRIVKLSGNN